MALLDLTLHVWDLGRVTGQEYGAPDAAVTEELTGAVAQLAPTARKRGVVGELVGVAEGASDFERLLAGTGRNLHRVEPGREPGEVRPGRWRPIEISVPEFTVAGPS